MDRDTLDTLFDACNTAWHEWEMAGGWDDDPAAATCRVLDALGDDNPHINTAYASVILDLRDADHLDAYTAGVMAVDMFANWKIYRYQDRLRPKLAERFGVTEDDIQTILEDSE